MWRLTDSCCHEILAIDWKTVPGGILLNSSAVSKKYPMPVFHQIYNVEAHVWNEIGIGSKLVAENS